VAVYGRTSGDIWYNAGRCCAAPRNSFTLKDWYQDGFKICVEYTVNGKTTPRTLESDARNAEITFSIAPNPLGSDAVAYRGCVIQISTGKKYYNGYTYDFIE
jgi:hypothetical protein